MQISQITKDDVTLAVQLIRALNTAKFADLSAVDMAALQRTLAWTSRFCQVLGKSYENEQNAALEKQAAEQVPVEVIVRKKTVKGTKFSPKGKR